MTNAFQPNRESEVAQEAKVSPPPPLGDVHPDVSRVKDRLQELMRDPETHYQQIKYGPLYYVSRGRHGRGDYAETTNYDEESGDFDVVAYLTRQEADEAAKKFPGGEVIETSEATDPRWYYRPLSIVGI